MFKKGKVVILPTNDEKALIKKLKQNGNLVFHNLLEHVSQHLHIISDEEIKEGEWVFYDVGYARGIRQASSDDIYAVSDCFKKIIATTDKLMLSDLSHIPQPSQSFINKFISEYNKGNVIEKVLVEYEEYTRDIQDCIGMDGEPNGVDFHVSKLKIGKDNTITIKRVKDSWNREEVALKLSNFSKDFSLKNKLNFGESLDYTIKWIDKNL